MKNKISIVLLLVIPFLCYGQQDIANILSNHMAGWTTEGYAKEYYDSKPILAFKDNIILSGLEKYYISDNPKVRNDAYHLVTDIGLRTTNLATRQKVCIKLLQSLSDTDESIPQQSARVLVKYHSEDFNEEAKSILSETKPTRGCFKYHLILLYGIANLIEKKQELLAIISEPVYKTISYQYDFGSDYGAALKALGRMGDEKCVQKCIDRVVQEKDIVRKRTLFLDDIAYLNNEEALTYFLTILKSQERLPIACKGPGMKANQYAAVVVAEMLQNTPVKGKYVGEYTNSDIQKFIQIIESKKYLLYK
jgi:hypothetical protein